MNHYEFAIIVLNSVILLIAYLSVYPKVAGVDINKVAFWDVFASGLALLIVAAKYWGTGQEFNLFFTHVNWFWFTFISYGIIEIPIALWYFRKVVFSKTKS